MMDQESQLRMQAYLDRELPAAEARRVEAQIAQDAEAAALLAELKGTNAALKVFEQELKLPESREFFWSKVEREINRREAARPAAETPSWLVGWKRWLMPATAAAVLAIAALIAWPGSGPLQHESALADPGAFTYRDFVTGTTLVWLTYPAENQFTDDQANSTLQ